MDEHRPSSEQLSAIDNTVRMYFQPLRERSNAVEQFILERHYPHEVVLLLCAYLDALATTVLGMGGSSEARLSAFLETFSSFGPRWLQISLPDLYELIVHAELWTNLYFSSVPLRRDQHALLKSLRALGFSMKDWDEYDAVERVLRGVSKKLARLGKVTPGEGAGLSLFEDTEVYSALGPRWSQAFEPVVSRFRVGGILYRNFRCSSVHELHLPAWLTEDERFWTEEEPYFVVREDKLDPSLNFLALAFPARFMLKTLKECIDRVQRNLIATRTIPVDIWADVFLGT